MTEILIQSPYYVLIYVIFRIVTQGINLTEEQQ